MAAYSDESPEDETPVAPADAVESSEDVDPDSEHCRRRQIR